MLSSTWGSPSGTVQLPKEVTPYTVNIDQGQLDRTQTLLKLSPIPGECYENSLPDGSRKLGLRREWLVEAKRVWEEEFSWRAVESQINSFPNFTASVPVNEQGEQINVQFLGIFSQNPNAVPVVFLHGWPGSILEFLPLFSLLREKYPDPARLPFHLIAPSLPGFGFSDQFPNDRNYGMEDVAFVVDSLMVGTLGLKNYVVQGGDIGSRIARVLGNRCEQCSAVLINYSPVPPPESFDFTTLSEKDKRGLERGDWFRNDGSAYAMMAASRPGTLGLALSASPLALLAWIGEKYLDWTDPLSFTQDQTLPSGARYSRKLMNEIIASVALYWLTGKIHTSFYSYREAFALNGRVPPSSNAQFPVMAPKKVGMMWFPYEVIPTPRAWIEKYSNLVFWREEEVGGHFAQLEQPEVLAKGLEDFIKVLQEK
ncbi:hypothetical protein QC761_700510 [Podospora bellae-mahoneyi]|uniref:Epoxide hydrolase N-terminal domain-containing protein n=1 Tax=Podospora bellae-mahoneyi TaxID=2093777 RepID=A0ABR0F9G2_9PEZI|nr:hypothetical protein QC761_700510 [Podospora bellae-mahoneyi]